jgi:hypothetical protein
MKYFINTLEKKTSTTGKSYIKAELRDEQNNITPGVSIWQDFPSFENITFGAEINADIVTKGNFKNAYPVKTYKSFAAKPNMAAIVDKKNENIKEAQGRKEDAIIRAGAQRDAVLIVTTFYKNQEFSLSDADIQAKIDYWMKYFLAKADQPFQ